MVEYKILYLRIHNKYVYWTSVTSSRWFFQQDITTQWVPRKLCESVTVQRVRMAYGNGAAEDGWFPALDGGKVGMRTKQHDKQIFVQQMQVRKFRTNIVYWFHASLFYLGRLSFGLFANVNAVSVHPQRTLWMY